MSVIAGKVYSDKIVVCADSIIVNGTMCRTTGNLVKLFQINGMIIGGSGTGSEIMLMQHYARTHNPLAASEKEVLAFMIEFKKYATEMGTNVLTNSYLMAYNGELFRIEQLMVVRIKDYDAIGMGYIEATTAMHLGHSASEAVKVACDLNCYVAEPILQFEMTR